MKNHITQRINPALSTILCSNYKLFAENRTENSSLSLFSCSFSPQLPELLMKLNCSIAITTYQAGKLVFISPADENRLTQLPRTFAKSMGFDVNGDRMVLATKDEIIFLENSRELAVHYPNKKNTYDSLFIPRATFYSGNVDMHDVALGTDGIWAINTSFSCLCQVTGNFNFIPKWQPTFITQLVSEDRCHLNGMVLVNGKPKYVTALGKTNTHQVWRDTIIDGGILMDVETNEIILDKLPMPHSPMMYKDESYMLLSATGEVIRVNIKEKKYEVIKQLNGFCRGMDVYGDHLFVAMSKLRKNSSTFAKLTFADKADTAGIRVIHLPTKALVAEINYTASVDEIYSLNTSPSQITQVASGLLLNVVYKVKVTDSKGCTVTTTVAINPCFACKEEQNNFNITVSPNPTNGVVNLATSCTNCEIMVVNIYNNIGKLMLSETHYAPNSSEPMPFDLSNYAKGIYLFDLRVGDKQKTIKVVLE